MNVARRMRARRLQGTCPVADNDFVDAGAIQAAAAASAASYRSFADATRSVLDLLSQQIPDAAVFLAHLDRGQQLHRVVDARNGGEFGLRSNLAFPLDESYCALMINDRGPRLCNDVRSHPVYGRSIAQARFGAAPTSACRSSSPTGRASARCAPSAARPACSAVSTSSSSRCSRACSPTSSSARPTSATCAA